MRLEIGHVQSRTEKKENMQLSLYAKLTVKILILVATLFLRYTSEAIKRKTTVLSMFSLKKKKIILRVSGSHSAEPFMRPSGHVLFTNIHDTLHFLSLSTMCFDD